MAPEILIVGDPEGHADLAQRIRSGGYGVDVCAPASIDARMSGGRLPGAIVVCIEDADPAELMQRVRGSRFGAAVPVALYGPPGHGVADLADVLDLGADHFVAEPASDAELYAALEELAGPTVADGPSEHTPTGSHEPPRVAQTGSYPGDRSVSSSGRGSSVPGLRGSDPVIGQLHRTLDMLEERLRGPGPAGPRVPPRDDVDLDDLGLDRVPDVDAELGPGDSHDRMPVDQFDLPLLSESAAPRMTPDATPDATVLLEESGPVTGARVRTSPDARDRRRRRPESSDAKPPRDRPRRAEPLPIDEQGDLAKVEVPRLVWVLHRAFYTGRLTVRRGRTQKQVWFQDGRIVFARSNLGHDRLVDGLMRRGMLTRAQYDAVRRMAAREPRRAGQILVESGFVKSDELHQVLRDHLTRIVDSTFGWEDGAWELEPDDECEEAVTLSASTARLLADGIRDRMDVPQLTGLLGGARQYPRFVAPTASGGTAALAEQLALGATEQAWLSRLDGRHTLRQLAASPGADPLELMATTYVLHVIGHVELSGEAAPTPKASRDPAEIDAERLMHRLELARKADYFALLGVGRDACRLDVRRAHADLCTTFAPDRLEPGTREQFADELAELRAILDEARDLLSDDGLRNAYLAHLDDDAATRRGAG